MIATGLRSPSIREYPLHDYPSLDASNAAIVADAYNPTTNGTKVRYPKNYGFLQQ